MSKPVRSKYIIKVCKGRRQWFWKTCFVNGKILQTSETYSSKSKAMQSALNNFNSYKRGHAAYEVEED